MCFKTSFSWPGPGPGDLASGGSRWGPKSGAGQETKTEIRGRDRLTVKDRLKQRETQRERERERKSKHVSIPTACLQDKARY